LCNYEHVRDGLGDEDAVFAMIMVAGVPDAVYLRIGAVTTPGFLELRFDRQTKMMYP